MTRLTSQSFTSMSTASFHTLPIELLHRIIDYVDIETSFFFSFRNVCKRFSKQKYSLFMTNVIRLKEYQLRH
jgi:hypothetical protein